MFSKVVDYRTHDYEGVFSLLHPRRFLPRLSGEYIVFTEIYEGRNATGMVSLFQVVNKNKQMEDIEQNRTKSKD